MKHLTAALIMWIGGVMIAHAAAPASVSPAQADSW
jgi:hypothetical protein